MAQKHLHELLKEDQEPFYTANKRFHLKRLNFSSSKTSSLQIKKFQKQINQTPSSKLCKNTCFFSFGESPELRKSPLCLPSPAPAKSPENGRFVLNVPARTAALLLEAAMRIQKQQSSSKPKTQIKKVKFGVFGSILKKLKDRNSDKNGEKKFSCSCNNSRVNSEINEGKLIDMENYSNYGDFGSSPLSPFRFSLQRCPSTSGYVSPEFTSPAASPVCHKKEDKENYETIIGLASIDQLEEEEDKEQCSPVSVLDPPFEEEDGHADGDEDEDEDEDEDSDLDCNYALVQRAQQQLLSKLRRFEKLAELDPIELEKILLEEEEEEEDDDRVEEEECQVFNLIFEEKFEVKSLNYGEAVFGRECKKIDLSSQELRSNTIDMMVKSNLKSEFDDWNEFQDQREETAIEFAFSIFGLLVDELGEELIHLAHS
ncbi:uncharacterized protein LOC125807021 [Solanum verrucosum]|uniref:uncharacterized protein LOC125807021 n=1 Tax=Solanum verrucosum TaxID=315347 RepID=UPI0020D0B225|nr:uncharacterized protein LOC125807021 [Solanum verrucosum]